MAAALFQSEKSTSLPWGHGNNWDQALADGHIWVHRPDSLGGCSDVHWHRGTHKPYIEPHI